MVNATLGGPKPSASSFLFSPSWTTLLTTMHPPTFKCSATTKVLYLAGRQGEVVIARPTLSPDTSTNGSSSSMFPSASISSMFPAPITLQMALPEVFSLPGVFSYPQSSYQETYPNSSQTWIYLSLLPITPSTAIIELMGNSWTRWRIGTREKNSYATTMPGRTNVSWFTASNPLPPAQTRAHPRPYPVTLTPLISALRPYCLTHEYLRLWMPASSRSRLDNAGCPISISENDLDRIITVISHSHAPSTQETYGSGLLVFHVFCDSRRVPEEQMCLVSSVLLLAFITSCMGLYSRKTLANYFYRIRAWHLLHGQLWLAQ